MSTSLYSIGDGVILKGADTIARFDAESKKVITATALHHKTQKAISDALGNDLVFVVVPDSDPNPGAGENAGAGEEGGKSEGENGSAPTSDEVPPVSTIPGGTDVDPTTIPPQPPTEPQGDIPPEPERDPAMGDKTPAFVAWLYKYHPKEAARRYANRNVPNPNQS